MGEITIQNLTKRFSDEENTLIAVDDISINIENGEFLVLVGPSGCGKSTTLRCISGLESVSEGSILLDGNDITNARSRDRDIAMVFQNYALYPHMTARNNMSFGLKMSTDMSGEEIRQRVDDTASMMGINDLLEKKPGELSGGQQQRVALGRAIVREPEAFLMDEPLSNLDAKLRTQMRTELQNLQQDLGTTTIYVTHDQTEAMTMGDRIAILEGGKLQQIGTPLECYHAPTNRFVASFIGSPSMNFFETTHDHDKNVLSHEEFDYMLDDSMSNKLTDASEELTLGIRPEDIRLADGNEKNTLNIDVDVVEPLGDESFVYFKLGEQSYTASINGEHYVQEGEVITVVFPQDRIHIFDHKTGEAVKNRTPPESAEMKMGNIQSSYSVGQVDD